MITEEQKTFKEEFLTLSKRCLSRKNNCLNEESAKIGLILPFLQLLGYDVFNINEVTPEYPADFSDKYQNRVDYVINKDNKPVIAIEAKLDIEKSDRGQLKSYFNAVQSIKLGILTDGIKYEFFADNNSPNIMDDNPFLVFDLAKISNGIITDNQLEDLLSFRKGAFNPENIGAEAKKKIIFNSIISFFETNLDNPSEDFIRDLLRNTDEYKNNRITKNVIEENADVVKTAFNEFIEKCISDRLGLNKKKEEETVKKDNAIEDIKFVSDIVTTNTELEAFNYIKQRLAFLVDSDELYQGIKYIEYKDFKTSFTVFYKYQRAGRILSLVENADQSQTFIFPDGTEINCKEGNYNILDTYLLGSYKKVFNEVK